MIAQKGGEKTKVHYKYKNKGGGNDKYDGHGEAGTARERRWNCTHLKKSLNPPRKIRHFFFMCVGRFERCIASITLGFAFPAKG